MTLRQELEDAGERFWRECHQRGCTADKLRALSQIIRECVESCIRYDIENRRQLSKLRPWSHSAT